MAAKKSKAPKGRKKVCPKCGNSDVVPIEYGYPGPEMIDAAEKGLIELGGCCVSGDDPQKLCRACGEQCDRPNVRVRTSSG